MTRIRIQSTFVLPAVFFLALAGCRDNKAEMRAAMLSYEAAFEGPAAKNQRDLRALDAEIVSRTRAAPQDVVDLLRTDSDARVRRWCAVFLAEARVKESAPGLARAIGSDPDPVLAGYSALALRDLLRAFDGDRAVRGAALDGALAFMDRLLAGRKANGFGSVLDIADQLKDPSLVGPLARVAKRASDLHSYEHIVTTIHSIGGKPAQQALRALLQGEKNPDRRAYLQGLLRS